MIPIKYKRMIIGLITQHSGLNYYLSRFKYDPIITKHNNGNCDKCAQVVPETVEHYIMKCDAYNIQRNILYTELQQIHIYFKSGQNINLQAILYPFTIIRLRKCATKIMYKLIKYCNTTNRNIYGNKFTTKDVYNLH